MVEHQAGDLEVRGSSPSLGSNFLLKSYNIIVSDVTEDVVLFAGTRHATAHAQEVGVVHDPGLRATTAMRSTILVPTS